MFNSSPPKKSLMFTQTQSLFALLTLLLTLLRVLSLKKWKKKSGSFYLLRWLSWTVEQETLRPNP